MAFAPHEGLDLNPLFRFFHLWEKWAPNDPEVVQMTEIGIEVLTPAALFIAAELELIDFSVWWPTLPLKEKLEKMETEEPWRGRNWKYLETTNADQPAALIELLWLWHQHRTPEVLILIAQTVRGGCPLTLRRIHRDLGFDDFLDPHPPKGLILSRKQLRRWERTEPYLGACQIALLGGAPQILSYGETRPFFDVSFCKGEAGVLKPKGDLWSTLDCRMPQDIQLSYESIRANRANAKSIDWLGFFSTYSRQVLTGFGVLDVILKERGGK